MTDGSNGYEAAADIFIKGRGTGGKIGASTVREWAKTLKQGATVLDLGCGTGIPVSQVLLDAGLTVFGVDASPSIIAAFRARFPDIQCECNSVESSVFFNRTFDGAIAWGLVFLLRPPEQIRLVHKVSGALDVGGQFAFTSPAEECEWNDAITGMRSYGLGARVYRRELVAAGFELVDTKTDEGDNHYYIARKTR